MKQYIKPEMEILNMAAEQELLDTSVVEITDETQDNKDALIRELLPFDF